APASIGTLLAGAAVRQRGGGGNVGSRPVRAESLVPGPGASGGGRRPARPARPVAARDRRLAHGLRRGHGPRRAGAPPRRRERAVRQGQRAPGSATRRGPGGRRARPPRGAGPRGAGGEERLSAVGPWECLNVLGVSHRLTPESGFG